MFRCNARSHFITYPRCPIELEHMCAVWEQFTARHPYQYMIIAKEHHEDGEVHYHVAVQWKSKRDIKNADILDFKVAGVNYHPNIQVLRDWDDTKKYLEKEGDFRVFGELIESDTRKRKKADDDDEAYRNAMATANDEQEFLAKIMESNPRDFVLHLDKIQAAAQHLFRKEVEEYVPAFTRDTFTNVPQGCDEWAAGNLDHPQPYRPRSLVIVGPSRLGKTEWARSLGRHSYFNNMFMLDVFDAKSNYAVFDDIDWKYFPNIKGWLGGQREFIVTDKYRKKRKIEWGHPCIWLTNKPLKEHEGFTDGDLDWLLKNVDVVYANERFY